MRILVLGQGGREHALVQALLSSSTSTKPVHVVCAPGSDGIALDAECIPINASHGSAAMIEIVLNIVKQRNIELVVIGPEQPLVSGVADDLRKAGVLVFGPSGAAARLEGSKIFSKEFMTRARVPTASYAAVASRIEARNAREQFSLPFVFKFDGLAAGKGVYIVRSETDFEIAMRETFDENKFGPNAKVLIEAFLPGWELSYLVLTNGIEYEPLVLAQDHKRLGTGDEGPNTGGMGTVAPLEISSELDKQIRERIMTPIMHEMVRSGLDYRGVLYVGLMIGPDGPSVLEFNVRFGDPEAQVILPLLDFKKNSWAEIFRSVAEGVVPKLSWSPDSAVCVVLAAEGYPEKPLAEVPLVGPIDSLTRSKRVLHAGTRKDSKLGWVTAGGRVLNVVARGANLSTALDAVYEDVRLLCFSGALWRRDIGKKFR